MPPVIPESRSCLEEEVIHRTVRRFKVQYGTYTTPVNVGGSYEEGRGNA